ncbi:hypothetical protein GOV14_03900 [Candidatus Pacearchaeota archaeon]|nr:hypothetical protein [Candidatus Pacearchaeota archaeon]
MSTANQTIGLENLVLNNGFISAARISKNALMTNHGWRRDAYWIYKAADTETKSRLYQGLKIFLSKNLNDTEFLPPLHDKDYNFNEEWAIPQNDAVGLDLSMAINQNDKETAQKLINYLERIKFWQCPDYGIWEGDGQLDYPGQVLKKRIHTSSICACAKGVEQYQTNIDDSSQVREMLSNAYQRVEDMLPHEALETETQNEIILDSGLMFTLYDPIKPIKEDKQMQEKLWDNLNLLEKENGFIRFPQDRWNGVFHVLKNNPMHWPMFFGLKYLITKDKKYFDKFENLMKPNLRSEGFIDGISNGTDLNWNRAFSQLCKKQYALAA